ncbi:MAG: S-layer homology domain-containing protein [Candidatus Syntrophopropionicum ammoniitolerans]
MNLRPAVGQDVILNNPLIVNWLYDEDVLNHRPLIMLYDDITEKWLEQPARIVIDGSIRTISARVWGVGRLVLVDDRRPKPQFKDTAGHWADSSISKLAAGGILAGFPDYTFKPAEPVTRPNLLKPWPLCCNGPSHKTHLVLGMTSQYGPSQRWQRQFFAG